MPLNIFSSIENNCLQARGHYLPLKGNFICFYVEFLEGYIIILWCIAHMEIFLKKEQLLGENKCFKQKIALFRKWK